MKKRILFIGLPMLLVAFLVTGVVLAATEWKGDNTFSGIVNFFPNGVKIGQQGTGGVTFFNGSIVNQTTNDGVDNPVTFGDNVRIDGAIWRGTNKSDDPLPVKVQDNLRVHGSIETDPQTSYLSIPGTSFVGQRKEFDRDKAIYIVSTLIPGPDTSSGAGVYQASVNLPHGAKVKKVTATMLDNVSGNGTSGVDQFVRVEMFKSNNDGKNYITGDTMATVDTEGAPSSENFRNVSSANINNETIDNENNSYSLFFSNLAETVNTSSTYYTALEKVVVEYEYTKP